MKRRRRRAERALEAGKDDEAGETEAQRIERELAEMIERRTLEMRKAREGITGG